MLPELFSRQARRSILIEYNPHQVLVAGISRARRGPVVVEFAAEFEPQNTVALREWLDGRTDFRRAWLPAICGFVPQRIIVQRESVNAGDLNNPMRLARVLQDQQLRRSGSSAPFRTAAPEDWVFRAVAADDGEPLPSGDQTRPALVLAVARQEVREAEQRMLDCRLLPARIEPALLPLFGTIYGLMVRRHQTQATVVFVVGEENTSVYILGKEGVHTPGSVSQGLLSLVQHVRRDYGLETDEAARRRLRDPSGELRQRAPRLLRSLAGSLRPVIDSYEMTTGQPVGQIYCAYLPPALAWMAEPLARAVGHEPLAVDCQEWMPRAGIQAAPGVPPFGPHWLGALSLVAHLPENAVIAPGKRYGPGGQSVRPWHIDTREPMDVHHDSPLRLLGKGLAAAAMIFGLAAAGWQGYAVRALRADSEYWRDQLAANRQLFTELTTAAARLRTQEARLEQAHALMHAPFPATDFLLNLGRSRPARIRLDRVEFNPGRVVLGGSVLEPAEEASLSLGAYLETLRRSPEFGGMFTRISATSLQRAREDDALAFEITMTLPAPAP